VTTLLDFQLALERALSRDLCRLFVGVILFCVVGLGITTHELVICAFDIHKIVVVVLAFFDD